MSADNFNLYAHYRAATDKVLSRELLRTECDRSWTYSDIYRQAGLLAGYLASLGLEPGDRVTVQVAKSPESLCLYLGCLKAGFIYHPLNLAYKSQELDFFLADAEPSVVIVDPGNVPTIESIAKKHGIKRIETLDEKGSGTLIEKAAMTNMDIDTVQRDRDDIAALLYSSGTTGQPKGIMLSHDNLFSNMQTLCDSWGFSGEDRLLHALPIFHVHGLFVAIGCVMLAGASMRWLPGFNATEVIKFLPECTVLMGVPTYYTRLLAADGFNATVCENMRLFVSGSAPLLTVTFAEFEQRTGHRILERYGMTETNMNTSNPLHGERKPGTVGLPLAGVSIRVVDESGSTLPAGETGDLQVRGPNVFKGYWRKPDKTAADFSADGFFNTGDKGNIDNHGYLSIVGRAKDLVISGGLNIYPREIESFIDDLPGVKESAVIGVPHADFGEAAVAVVVAESDATISEGNIIAACKQQLADFKVPKTVELVAELPRNTMSKVQKNVLRETYQDLFR